MKVANHIEALIGTTPLVDLTELGSGNARILGKYEATNPGGSVKDRIAKAMLDPAAPSSSRPPATPASAWPCSPPRVATR